MNASNSNSSGKRSSQKKTSGTFLEFVEAKAALGDAVRSSSVPTTDTTLSSTKPKASGRKGEVRRLIDQLQVQQLSSEGALPGGKSIPSLPNSPGEWIKGVKLAALRRQTGGANSGKTSSEK